MREYIEVSPITTNLEIRLALRGPPYVRQLTRDHATQQCLDSKGGAEAPENAKIHIAESLWPKKRGRQKIVSMPDIPALDLTLILGELLETLEPGRIPSVPHSIPERDFQICLFCFKACRFGSTPPTSLASVTISELHPKSWKRKLSSDTSEITDTSDPARGSAVLKWGQGCYNILAEIGSILNILHFRGGGGLWQIPEKRTWEIGQEVPKMGAKKFHYSHSLACTPPLIGYRRRIKEPQTRQNYVKVLGKCKNMMGKFLKNVWIIIKQQKISEYNQVRCDKKCRVPFCPRLDVYVNYYNSATSTVFWNKCLYVSKYVYYVHKLNFF